MMRTDKFIRCPFCGEVPFPPDDPPTEYKGVSICTHCGAAAPDFVWVKRNFEEKLLQELQTAMEAMIVANTHLCNDKYDYAIYVLVEEVGHLRQKLKEYQEGKLIWEK